MPYRQAEVNPQTSHANGERNPSDRITAVIQLVTKTAQQPAHVPRWIYRGENNEQQKRETQGAYQKADPVSAFVLHEKKVSGGRVTTATPKTND